MTQLLLIRHATNDSLKADKLTGWTPGVTLNEEGLAQARTLVTRLEGVPIAAIYSSPLERAVQTAQPLAQARGLEIQARAGLGEVHIGDWTGRSISELIQTDTWRQFQVQPSLTRFPNGESGQEMQARAVAELDAICTAHPGDTVAIFSHADVIKAIVAYYAGLHMDHFQRLVVSPASISVVWAGPSGSRLVRLNDTGRLDDLIPPQLPPIVQDPDAKEQG
ncbi:MAG: MSMEG_4193 family putative phosphomutase [Thermoflexales bacterium]|nr:MSMEG_4193 family putative phosphomutase [Thermoflexales bacterium]